MSGDTPRMMRMKPLFRPLLDHHDRGISPLAPVQGLTPPSIPLPFHWRAGTCSQTFSPRAMEWFFLFTIALIVTVLIGTALISTALFATDRVVTLCILPLRGVYLSQVVHLRLSTLCLCAFSSLRFCLESLQLCSCIFVFFSSFSRLDFKQTLCICELCTWTRQKGFVHREPHIFS